MRPKLLLPLLLHREVPAWRVVPREERRAVAGTRKERKATFTPMAMQQLPSKGEKCAADDGAFETDAVEGESGVYHAGSGRRFGCLRRRRAERGVRDIV